MRIKQKTNLLYLFLGVILFGLSSCEAPFIVEDDYTKSKLVMEAISTPSKEVSAIITTSININQASDVNNAPEDVDCYLYTENGDKIKMEFEHRDDTPKYWANGYYPKEGERLEIIVSYDGFTKILANTTVPHTIQNMDVEFSYDVVSVDNDHFNIDGNLEVSLADNINTEYVLFDAILIFSPYEMVDSEVLILEGPKIKKYIEINTEKSDKNIYDLTHKPGLGCLVDVQNEPYTVVVSSSAPIPNNYKLTDIKYTVTNVNEDFYRYQKSLDLSALSLESNYTEPVIGYSNVYNGIGVFGAKSKAYKAVLPVQVK